MQRFLKRCKPIAKVVLFFAVWQFLQLYNLAYAFTDTKKRNTATQSPPAFVKNDIEQQISGTQALLKQIADDVDKGKPVSSNLEKVKGFRAQIDKEHDNVTKYFADMRRHLEEKGLAQEIIRRHDATVESYSAKHKELIKKLENIQATKAENLKPVLAQAMDFLHANSHQKKQIALDPENLPHGMSKIKARKPRTTLEEYKTANITAPSAGTSTVINTNAKQTAKATTVTASSARTAAGINTVATQGASAAVDSDLSETIEVKFTQPIRDLATQLEHNPLKIFNWVRNTIEFVPTYGSIQGAEMCLMTKQGNAFDTASLLIALLRVSNVHARYAYGTVEIPKDKAMNWVGGVTDPIVAGRIFASCGIPARLMYKASQVLSIQIEHVWVEAYIDYSPSRGATHVQGDTWIPMDASFKQYAYTDAMNLKQVVPLNGESVAQQLLSSGTINENEGWATGFDTAITENATRDYIARITQYIDNNTSNNFTAGDLIGGKQFVKFEFPLFPATLPYKTVVQSGQYNELPDSLRQSITFDFTENTITGEPDFTVTKSLPELTGKKITISYSPATQADRDLIKSFIPKSQEGKAISATDFPASLPSYLIHLKPTLLIDGESVAVGTSISMGMECRLDIKFNNTESVSEVSKTILAGEYTALALDTQHISHDALQTVKERINTTKTMLEQGNMSGIGKDKIIGDMFYISALSYFSSLDNFSFLAAKAMKIVFMRFLSPVVIN